MDSDNQSASGTTKPADESHIEGNRVLLLQNGKEIFPSMLEAIRRAESSICFETYVYWSGEIARVFAAALKERAEAGVEVHVILDWHGSMKMSRDLVDSMENSGVQVEYYRPLKWFNFRRTNYRTHRKLLVVDGKIGFAGGVGVADEWSGNAQDPDHWRDNPTQSDTSLTENTICACPNCECQITCRGRGKVG